LNRAEPEKRGIFDGLEVSFEKCLLQKSTLFDRWWNGIPGSRGLHHETKDSKPKGKSTFERQKIAKTGFARKVCSSVSLSALDGRVWIGLSAKSFSGVVGRVSVVAFERNSSLEGICDSGFRGSELKSIVIHLLLLFWGKRVSVTASHLNQ
jgi:hypothetical protein